MRPVGVVNGLASDRAAVETDGGDVFLDVFDHEEAEAATVLLDREGALELARILTAAATE